MKSDEKWIYYNNVKCKKLWGKQNQPSLTTPKASLHSRKGAAFYMVGFGGSRLEWDPSKETNDWSEQLLLLIKPIGDRSQWKLRKGSIFYQTNDKKVFILYNKYTFQNYLHPYHHTLNIRQSNPKVQPILNVAGRWQWVVPELCCRELRFLVGPPKADWSDTQRY